MKSHEMTRSYDDKIGGGHSCDWSLLVFVVGMVKQPAMEASEFTMSHEDFPALPGASQQQRGAPGDPASGPGGLSSGGGGGGAEHHLHHSHHQHHPDNSMFNTSGLGGVSNMVSQMVVPSGILQQQQQQQQHQQQPGLLGSSNPPGLDALQQQQLRKGIQTSPDGKRLQRSGGRKRFQGENAWINHVEGRYVAKIE